LQNWKRCPSHRQNR